MCFFLAQYVWLRLHLRACAIEAKEMNSRNQIKTNLYRCRRRFFCFVLVLSISFTFLFFARSQLSHTVTITHIEIISCPLCFVPVFVCVFALF